MIIFLKVKLKTKIDAIKLEIFIDTKQVEKDK